jgi:hypothetical protein
MMSGAKGFESGWAITALRWSASTSRRLLVNIFSFMCMPYRTIPAMAAALYSSHFMMRTPGFIDMPLAEAAWGPRSPSAVAVQATRFQVLVDAGCR